MRAFITGATGFAGLHLAEWLIECGDEVVGSTREGRWSTNSAAPQMSLIPWDLASGSTEALSEMLQRFQPAAVYHLAALSVPSDCGGDEPTAAAWKVNVEATQTLVQLLAGCSWRPRLVLASTSHVYGPQAGAEVHVGETHPVAPRSGYAKTKWAAEQAVLAAARAGRVDALVARAFKHAGPRQGERMMLIEWISQFVRGADPVVVQCLDSHVDLSDVRDVVRAYRLLAQLGVAGEIYNVGSGCEQRTGDLFFRLREMVDATRPYQESRPGRKQEWIADVSKLVAATGWRTEHPWERMIRDALDEYRRRA